MNPAVCVQTDDVSAHVFGIPRLAVLIGQVFAATRNRLMPFPCRRAHRADAREPDGRHCRRIPLSPHVKYRLLARNRIGAVRRCLRVCLPAHPRPRPLAVSVQVQSCRSIRRLISLAGTVSLIGVLGVMFKRFDLALLIQRRSCKGQASTLIIYSRQSSGVQYRQAQCHRIQGRRHAVSSTLISRECDSTAC